MSPYVYVCGAFLLVLFLQGIQTRWRVRWCREKAEQYVRDNKLDVVIEQPGEYPPHRLWLHTLKSRRWAILKHTDGREEYLRMRPIPGSPVRFDVFT